MTNEKVATMIKHLATYLPIYEFVKDGAEDVETIKRHLMVEYGKLESTARAQVNAIDDSPLFIKERGVVSINKEATLELEKELSKANEKIKDKEETIKKLELQVSGAETEAIRENFARKDLEDKYELNECTKYKIRMV